MIFRSFLILLIFLGPLASPVPAAGQALKLVTSTPDLAWIIRQIGAEEVQVRSLLRATEDPHYVDAVPRFILEASRADMLCFIGLDLEVAWLPRVLEASRNSRIQSGGLGHCDLSTNIEVIGRQEQALDRSHGHVHPQGNPHYWLSLRQMSMAAQVATEHLARLRPERKPFFEERLQLLNELLADTRREASDRLRDLEGLKVIQYHAEFDYLIEETAVEQVPYTIEALPGVSPSARRILQVAEQAREDGVMLAIASPSAPTRQLRRFQELSGIRFLQLRTMSEGSDFPSFYLDLIEQLKSGWKKADRDDS